MIDFACKTFLLDEIIKCSLGITKADFKVMDFLVKNHEKFYTTEELSQELKLNLTTIQRAVKKLFEQKIVQRKQNNLDNGGYVFIYRIVPKKEVKETIMKIIDKWKENVETALEKW